MSSGVIGPLEEKIRLIFQPILHDELRHLSQIWERQAAANPAASTL